MNRTLPFRNDLITHSNLPPLGFPPGREGTGFPGSGPVPSGNRDGTEGFISRPVVPTGKGREGTGNAKKCQEMKITLKVIIKANNFLSIRKLFLSYLID